MLSLDYNELEKAIKKYKPKIVQLEHVYGCPAIDINFFYAKEKNFLMKFLTFRSFTINI